MTPSSSDSADVGSDASPTRSHNGLGMGLAIVRDLVRLHGGRIDVYSGGLNQGAVFVITLPLMPVDGTPEGGAELALVGT